MVPRRTEATSTPKGRALVASGLLFALVAVGTTQASTPPDSVSLQRLYFHTSEPTGLSKGVTDGPAAADLFLQTRLEPLAVETPASPLQNPLVGLLVLLLLACVGVITWLAFGHRFRKSIPARTAEPSSLAEAYRDSEERFRNLIEGSIQGIVIIRNWQPIFVNQAFANLVQMESVEAVLAEQSILSLIAPHDHERVRTLEESRIAGKSVTSRYDVDVVRRDGEILTVENAVRPIVWMGKPATQCTLVDITQRKQAERALRASEERFRNLIEASLQGIVVHRHRELLFANQTLADILGYGSVEELLELGSLTRIVAPDDNERLLEYQSARMRGEYAPSEYEHGAIRKDGSRITLQHSVRVVNWEGEPAIQGTYIDITERKQAENALRKSEERFKDFAATAADWFWEMDAELRFSYVSGRYEQIFDLSAEQILGKTREEVYGGHVSDEFLQKHRVVLEARKPIEGVQLRWARADGDEHDVLIIGKPIFDGDGNFVGYRGIGRDITEQKRAQDELRTSEERFRNLVEGSIQGVLIDRLGKPLYVNQAYADILGYDSPDEILAMESVESFFAGYDRARMDRYAKARLEGEPTPSQYEYTAIRKDGTPIECLNMVITTTWEGQQATQSTVIDITERKRAEEALRESEERFRNLIEGSLQGIFIHRDRETVFVNQAYADIMGYGSPEEILAIPTFDCQFADYERERLREYGRARLRGEAAPVQYEYDAVRKDGATVTLQAMVRVVIWLGVPAFQSSVIDITERKQAEKALRKAYDELEDKVTERTQELHDANEKLEELDRLKSMFIASMSHELRTPLNSIIGFTGVLLQGMSGDLNEKQRDQLTRVYTASKHLLALITDVIDISKIEAGKVDLFPESFQISQVVNEALDAVRPQLSRKNLDLKMDVPEDFPLYTDKKKLLQCMINLIGNAVKYTEKGEITVAAREVDHAIEFTVGDTGVGIPNNQFRNLFEPFQRIDSPVRAKTPGTGLGLYVTKKIATELLRGELSVESLEGEGSSFALKIPKTIELDSEIHTEALPGS